MLFEFVNIQFPAFSCGRLFEKLLSTGAPNLFVFDVSYTVKNVGENENWISYS